MQSKKEQIEQTFRILTKQFPSHPMHSAFAHDPWQMLIAVMLSQRSTDKATIIVAKQLFQKFPDIQSTRKATIKELEKILRPIGFYHQKAQAVLRIAHVIHEKFNGNVPLNEEILLSLPQIGQKTTNIMLTIFTNTPKIAVDVHVHRITQRLGWIQSRSVEETQTKLEQCIPKKYIRDVNRVFVQHGQEICRPISPKCSICPIQHLCRKVGVTRFR